MRILTLHAFYQVLGGEDVSHRTEVQHLRDRGHDVHDLTVENGALASLSTARRLRVTVSNPHSASAVNEAIAAHRPDVAYVNNVFPGLSSSVVRACRDAGIPTVRVLRNYRFACVSGNLFRDGEFCDACVGGSGLAGIRHACYRGSHATSAVATLARRADRIASANVRWIAISEYVKTQAMRAGLPAHSIGVRPNLTLPAAGASPTATDAPTVLYVGRDTVEKGLPLLLDAFARLREGLPAARLWVAGARRDDAPDGVTWLGQVPHGEVARLMASADVLAVPSVWPEPFGRVVIEALAAGTPVVAAASGGLAELAGPAVAMFVPPDAAALAAALRHTLEQDRTLTRALARERYAADFSPDVWYDRTMEAFAQARSAGPARS